MKTLRTAGLNTKDVVSLMGKNIFGKLAVRKNQQWLVRTGTNKEVGRFVTFELVQYSVRGQDVVFTAHVSKQGTAGLYWVQFINDFSVSGSVWSGSDPVESIKDIPEVFEYLVNHYVYGEDW